MPVMSSVKRSSVGLSVASNRVYVTPSAINAAHDGAPVDSAIAPEIAATHAGLKRIHLAIPVLPSGDEPERR